MKDFKEFAMSVSQDEFVKISQVINSNVKETRENTGDPSKILGNQVATLSYFMCLELLSRYHSWNNSEEQ